VLDAENGSKGIIERINPPDDPETRVKNVGHLLRAAAYAWPAFDAMQLNPFAMLWDPPGGASLSAQRASLLGQVGELPEPVRYRKEIIARKL